MRRSTEGAVLLAVGAVTANLAVSGAFQSYVRTGLRIPLLICAVLLFVVGAPAAFAKEDDDPEQLLGHDHVHGGVAGRVGVALLVPVVAVFLVAPAPLGAFAADRGAQNQSVEAVASNRGFEPLAVGADGVAQPSMREFLIRAYNAPELVEGVPVRLIGFVVAADAGGVDYLLTRFTMSCCAADALPLQVAVSGAPAVPAVEEWVAVEGTWSGDMVEIADGSPIPLLSVVDQQPTQQPDQPYDY